MSSSGRPWTKAEERKLRKLFPDTPMRELQRIFKRTAAAIQARANRLGIYRRGRWTKAEDRKLARLYPDTPTRDLVAVFGRPFSAIRSRVKRLKLLKRNRRRKWTQAKERKLKKLYPNTSNKDLAKLFGVPEYSIHGKAYQLGVHKSAAYLAKVEKITSRKLSAAGEKTRFKKGQVPPNKGVKGWDSGGRSHETRFKKGEKPPTWKPIGSKRLMDGYLQRKVTDTGYPPRDWVGVHILLWEEHHGPVPPKHTIVFRDGNRKNITIKNLECISRADLMRRNTIHNYPPEVKKLIRLHGKLTRTIRKREKPHGKKQD